MQFTSYLVIVSICREIVDDLGQSVNSVALSYDEGCILASCLDSTIRLLDRFPLSSSLKLMF